jgi:hypothetical protein
MTRMRAPTVEDEFDVVCDRLKALGFDGVELGAFPPHPNPGNPAGAAVASAQDDSAARANRPI